MVKACRQSLCSHVQIHTRRRAQVYARMGFPRGLGRKENAFAVQNRHDEETEGDGQVSCVRDSLPPLAPSTYQCNSIDRIGLFSWVTDKECKDWYPVEAPPRFEYIKKWSTVDMRGAQTLDEKERDGYLKKVQERVEKSFTTTRLKEAKEKLKDKKPFDSAFK